MKVSVVQSGNCTQNVSENVEMLLELSEQAAATNPDLILLPELATTPYFAAGDKSPKYRDWAEPVVGGASTAAFAKFAKDHNTALGFGMYEIDNDVRYPCDSQSQRRSCARKNSRWKIIPSISKVNCPIGAHANT